MPSGVYKHKPQQGFQKGNQFGEFEIGNQWGKLGKGKKYPLM